MSIIRANRWETVNGNAAGVLYVDTIADLQALPESELVDGQEAQVSGSAYKFVDQEWRPIGPVTAQAYGAKADGVTDDRSALQAYADELDTGAISTMYLPNHVGTYRISDRVVIKEPGVRIFGDRGPTYERGLGRPGNILLMESATAGLDLGAFRTSATTTNAADEWTVEGIGFIGSGVNSGQNAIEFTTQRNGPDRGCRLNRISGKGLHSVFYVPPLQGAATTSLANLCIENSNMSNNRHGVLSEGNVLGLRFVNNQAEQLEGEVIKGNFTSGITIRDNMLEGTQNPDGGTIDITALGATGNRLQVDVANNYFEANTGLFLMRFHSTSSSSTYLTVGPNYYQSPPTSTNTTVVSGLWPYVEYKDPWPLTLQGSPLLNLERTTSYKAASSSSAFTVPASSRYLTRAVDSDWLHVTSVGSDTVITPFGSKPNSLKFNDTSGYITQTGLQVDAGDLIFCSALVRRRNFSGNSFLAQLLDSNYANIKGSNTGIGSVYRKDNEWYLVCFSFSAGTAHPDDTIRFRIFGSGVDAEIAALAFKIEKGAASTISLEYPVEVSPVIPEW